MKTPAASPSLGSEFHDRKARRFLLRWVLLRHIPLGTHSLNLSFSPSPDFKPDDRTRLANDAFTVVGVKSDLLFFVGFRENYPHILLPYTTGAQAASTLILSTSLPPEHLVNPVRETIHAIDKDQPLTDVMTLRQMLDMYGYAGPASPWRSLAPSPRQRWRCLSSASTACSRSSHRNAPRKSGFAWLRAPTANK